MNQIKKISFLSAIVIIIGATVGAGIFVKNNSLLSLTQGRISFIVIAWVIAGVSLICLGIALFEVSSISKGNRGILEWTHAFLPKWLHKGATGYIGLFYYPSNILALAVYFVEEIDSIGSFYLNGWIIGLIGFFISSWIILLTGLSLNFGEKLQWVITLTKFVPLLVLPIIAYINIDGPASISTTSYSKGFAGISPWIGLFGTIPAIVFAFDGFYRSADIRNNLKNPKKASEALIIAVSAIFLLYLFFSTSFLFATKDGTYNSLTANVSPKIIVLFRSFICVAILGVINGYAIAAPNVIQSIWKNADFWHPKLFRFSKKDRYESTIFLLILNVIFFVVFIPLGILAYYNPDPNYSLSASSLYFFNSTFSNWSSIVVFLIIIAAIIGALINRTTKKVVVEKSRHFIWTAIIACVYILLGATFMFVQQIVDLTGYNNSDRVGAISNLSILIGTFIVAFLPYICEIISQKRKNKNKMITKS